MAALPAIMKTTAARLSALFLLLFAITAIALVFYMTSLSLRIFDNQTRVSVAEEMQGLSRIYRRGGLPALVRAVDRRSRQPGAYLYLIADPNGRILSGNVEELQPGVLERDGWTQRPFWYHRYGERTDDRRHRAIAHIIRLPNQMIALVGPRPWRARALSQCCAPGADVCVGCDGRRRISDLVFCRPPGVETHRWGHGCQPSHHGR